MTSPHAVVDHAEHTPYSDPGAHAGLLEALPTDLAELSAVARNVIVHYRSEGLDLPAETEDDINLRWVERMLATDQERHGTPLAEPRAETARLQGCCRDHTLLCVAALRTHGVPARSRVGYAGYFHPGWHADHVVAEAWLDGRWRRFDPEIGSDFAALPHPTDIPTAELGSTGFVTAAQVWAGHRAGTVDADRYGVDPHDTLLRGERFVFDEVIFEVAHRFGDELLLWDGWGRIGVPGTPVTEEDAAWADEVAALLLASDAGDLDAEAALLERYRSDPGLHPGAEIVQASPRGDGLLTVSLADQRG
ncbi:transglutaminase-like domain-containing protein [Pseudactinotalea suaedae]|uniref:transglutaminase-like domain-containing protein n=1 Tax=Pseudactinotalea suaedae TaxID=1524924 RepID=UPI0012E1D45A|nr:transglutaminase-like domain-containing protein [Pseudactinotalea suaedae]